MTFLGSLRRERITHLYLTDRPTWSFRYVAWRLCGVRRIIVHDRTSGERRARSGMSAWLKRALHRVRPLSADLAIGVSEFVTARLVRVNGMPPGRVARVYNGIDLHPFLHQAGGLLQGELGLPAGTPVALAAGRAMPYKGIPVLLEAAARLESAGCPVHVAYAGDGPGLEGFRARAAELGLRRFHFLGRRDDVPALLASATVAVVPSTWAEAFGLSVVEAMVAGRPLVATRVGGIPELVEDGVTGLLVAPGDPEALATAIRRVVEDAALAERLGAEAAKRSRTRFTLDRAVDELVALVQRLA